MKILKIAKSPYFSLGFNFIYGIGNSILGFVMHSWWFITLGAYYMILAATRFSVVTIKRKAKGNTDIEQFAKRVTGILILVLSFSLIGVNVLSIINEQGTRFHEIIMIAIATYTFTKIIVAIVGLVKAKHLSSPIAKTLRNISVADATVSVYTLQRSMLVSFPGMTAADIKLLNILTGTAVWIIVLLLGINLIGGKIVDMSKSKIVEANKKIADAVTDGYKKIEKGVVDGYKKIEKGVVDGYQKIEDKFVDAYLTKDGETVEEAKERLKKENDK